jgi:hypothetical protein
LEQYNPQQVIAGDARVERGAFWTISDLRIVVELGYGVTDRKKHPMAGCSTPVLSYQKVENCTAHNRVRLN